MCLPSPFLINSFSSFCLLLIKSSATDLSVFGLLLALSYHLIAPEYDFCHNGNVITFCSRVLNNRSVTCKL